VAGKCKELMIVTVGKRYLSRAEAAEFLSERGYKTAPATLAKRAVVGGGPPFVSWGRKPLYDPESLLEWAQRRCTGPRRSTSDRGEERQGADLGDSHRKLMKRQRAAATAHPTENQSPAPQAKDVAVETTGAHPPPPVAGKGAPLNFERYHACNKNTEFSSARRNADEGVA
jgi:hypothetical protein